ncbi:MAG TPA: hypothetical protein VGR35_04075 [Tepidisphaeraceae bacterium]|nr:hypothetical protein [Tepidisphaeraceae bacterium]
MSDAPGPLAIFPDQPVPAEFDLLCEHCGYSLVGLMVDRCPECGEPFDARALPLARVPWLYRKRLGRMGAYVQTLRLALFAPKRFAGELCRPVRISELDARRFRLLTIHLAALGMTLGLAGLLQHIVGIWPPRPSSAGMIALCLGAWVMTLLFLRMATDLPTFIWSGMPGRTYDLSPLHQYAAAPLALLLPAAGVFVGLVFMLSSVMASPAGLTETGTLALSGLLAVVLGWAWVTALVFMRTATRCSFVRVAMLGLYLPLHWLMMFAFVWLLVAAVAYYGAQAYEMLF